MKADNACPKCGSDEWVKDVNLDASGAIDLRFTTLPQEQGRSRLRACFCGDCGYIEFYAIYPRELLNEWKNRQA
jgi:predicted nucleic-acid-binding Zn-ribbon protein